MVLEGERQDCDGEGQTQGPWGAGNVFLDLNGGFHRCCIYIYIHMSALPFLHSIHVGVPGPTGDSLYLELLVYKVFHTAGPIQAGGVLVAQLSIFT